jgi:hypothetical protein
MRTCPPSHSLSSESSTGNLKSSTDKKLDGELNAQNQGKIKPCAPKIPGKNALIFCTYSGPHTGFDEATPAGKYMGQFFEHLGFAILGEWYVLSEFHGSEENSTRGRMGDIRGKPTEEDLKKIREDAKHLASKN